MVYIIAIIKTESGRISYYRGFDTLSNSVMMLETNTLMHMIEHTKIHVVNARVINNAIVLNEWAGGVHTEQRGFIGTTVIEKRQGTKYVLMSKDNNTYTTVDCLGNTRILLGDEMRALAKSGELANVGVSNLGNQYSISIVDMYAIQRDKEFESLIAAKYNSFIAKTTMLGHKDIEFYYEIEGHEVKLSRYNGSNKHVILPNFITAIMRDAFMGKRIATVDLNEGLKSIGSKAFSIGELARVEIPESVELIGVGAFGHNKKLFTHTEHLNMTQFTLRNQRTLVLDQAI